MAKAKQSGKPGKLALERWSASCKVILPAKLFAMHAAVCAESCYWTCQYARDAVWFKLAGGSVPVAKWRTLYRCSELLDLRYVAPLAVESTDKKAAAKFRREYRAMKRQIRDGPPIPLPHLSHLSHLRHLQKNSPCNFPCIPFRGICRDKQKWHPSYPPPSVRIRGQ